jgi:hypothetical protein
MENISRRIEQDIFIVSTSKPSLSNALHNDNPSSSSSAPSPGSVIDILSHRRPTWYTPPCKDRTKSVIPSYLFGRKCFSSSSSSSSTSFSNTIATSSTSSVVENDKIVADHFGFYRFGAGYKNIHTGETIYDHLLHEPRQ